MRDNGLSPGNKQGGQVCAQGGGGGEHILLGPAPKALRPRYRAEHGVCVLVGEGRLRGTGSGNQHSEQNEGAGCPRWSPRSLGFGQVGAEGELDCCCCNTENLGVSILRSLRKGAGAFTLVLQLELRSAASSPPQP